MPSTKYDPAIHGSRIEYRHLMAANQASSPEYKAANGHDPKGRIDFKAVHDASLRSLESILQRYLPGGRRSGNEWVALNPTRADAKPGSFKVNLRTGVWSDFATDDKGADAIDLVAYLKGYSKLDAARELGEMLGVPLTNGSAPLHGCTVIRGDKEPLPTPPAFYIYRLEDGAPYLGVQRKGDKKFYQRHWTGSEWKDGAPDGPKVPYRLPELLQAEHDTVVVVEGEKDADNLAALGFTTTTNSGGAGNWSSDLNKYFEGRDVSSCRIMTRQAATTAPRLLRTCFRLPATPTSSTFRALPIKVMPPIGSRPAAPPINWRT